MGIILAVAKHNLKMFFNNRLAIIILLAPILLSTFILGKMTMGQEFVKVGAVGVYSDDTSGLDKKLVEHLEERQFTVTAYEEEEIHKAVQEGKIDAAVVITSNNLLESILDAEQAIHVTYDEGNVVGKQIEDTLKSKLVKLSILIQSTEGDKVKLQALEEKYLSAMPSIEKEAEDTVTMMQIVFGMFTFMFLMVVGFSLSPIMREKEVKIYERINVSPIKKYEYLTGHILGSLCVLMVQIAMQIVAFKVFKVDTGIQVGPFFIIGGTLALVGISLSMLILSFTRKTSVYYMIIGLGVTPLCMVSDCLFPVELLPKWAVTLSYLSPIRWVMRGYKSMLQGRGMVEMFGALGIAVLMAIVIILISMVKEHYRIEDY